jgi:hypothetical protein
LWPGLYESRRDFVLQPRVGVFQPTLRRKEIKFATLKRVVAVLNIARRWPTQPRRGWISWFCRSPVSLSIDSGEGDDPGTTREWPGSWRIRVILCENSVFLCVSVVRLLRKHSPQRHTGPQRSTETDFPTDSEGATPITGAWELSHVMGSDCCETLSELQLRNRNRARERCCQRIFAGCDHKAETRCSAPAP